MPEEIIDTHELETITLDYRRECQHDDIVDSLTSSESTEGMNEISQLNETNGSATFTKDKQEEYCEFLHLLRVSGGGLEINRGRTQWRKKKLLS